MAVHRLRSGPVGRTGRGQMATPRARGRPCSSSRRHHEQQARATLDRHRNPRARASDRRGGPGGRRSPHRQPAGGPFGRLPGGGAAGPRAALRRAGLHQRLQLVRRGTARRPARLGLCRRHRLRLRQPARAVGDLRRDHRRADRRLQHRELLGQPLPRPALVRRAALVAWPAAAAPGGRLAAGAGATARMATSFTSSMPIERCRCAT